MSKYTFSLTATANSQKRLYLMMPIKQTILLNRAAMLLDSCDSLFDAIQYRNQNIIPYFPFLESVYETLWKQLKNQPSVVFPAVETKHPFLPGYYDYIFKKVDNNNGELIQWQILDVTENYEKLKLKQQIDNENNAFGSFKEY